MVDVRRNYIIGLYKVRNSSTDQEPRTGGRVVELHLYYRRRIGRLGSQGHAMQHVCFAHHVTLHLNTPKSLSLRLLFKTAVNQHTTVLGVSFLFYQLSGLQPIHAIPVE